MRPEGAEDADLLKAYVGGDRRAFEQLYDRWDRPCFLFIRRVLGSRLSDAAEDLHQETWTSVAKDARTFDPARAPFRAWLFTIGRNKVWDHFRRQKVVVVTSPQELSALDVPDQGPTPLEQVETREWALTVVAAVEALPLTQRDVFMMFVHSGLSLEEIAEVTGVGAETVKSRLRYARAALRRALGSERAAHV